VVYILCAEFDENTDSPLEIVEEDPQMHAVVEAQDKLKMARSKKTPSRYDDCMLDLSDIADPLPEEEEVK